MNTLEYTGIETYLRGRFRPLKGPDERPYAQLNTLPSGTTREEFMAASPLPDAVNKFLFQLDTKVDAILGSLLSSSLERDFPHEMEVFSISASRLTFSTTLPVAPGDWLEVVVSFRQSGIATASGIGSVAGTQAGKNGETIFSFTFSHIIEEEREKIMRYVFTEERRQLRETRLEQD